MIFIEIFQAILATTLICQFSINTETEEFYKCLGRTNDYTSSLPATITVEGKHISDKTDLDVLDLRITSLDKNLIPNGLGLHLPNVTQIRMSFVELLHITKDNFESFKKLEILKLSHNNLTRINQNSFGALEVLETLSLYKNKIVAVDSDAFVNLPVLQYLDLGFNNLIFLESGLFRNNLNLQSISFYNNQIEYVAYDVFSVLMNLTVIDFSNNNCVKVSFNQSDVAEILQAYLKKCRKISRTMKNFEDDWINGTECDNPNEKKVERIFDHILFRLFFGSW